jgi:hypothetical protein
MDSPLLELEGRRKQVLMQMSKLGDMRRGSITETYRRCGKATCWCQQEGKAGHGPFYAYTTKVEGKTQTVQLRPGPLLEKYRREVEAYRQFRSYSEELLALNETLCQIRPLSEAEQEEQTKKNSWRRLGKRSKRRSNN